MTKRPPLPVEVEADAAAGRAARRRVRCHPPTVAKRHTPPTIAATPAELAAALVPSAPPDVPAWLEDMGAGMDAADALATVTARGWTEPPADSPELPAPAVDPDARTLDAGAILEAAAELDAEPSEAAPKAIPPAMPPPAVERAAATREASRADAPAPVRAWACHCGKASVGPTCWGCGLPRERGERVEPAERRPPLTVLPGYAGGRPPDPVRVAALAELASSDDELAAAMAAKRRARLRLVEANGEPSA